MISYSPLMMVLTKGNDFLFSIDDGTSKGGPTSCSPLMMVLTKGNDLFCTDDGTSKGE